MLAELGAGVAAKPRARQLSPKLAGGLLLVFDFLAIVAIGVAVYVLYVEIGSDGWSSRYLATICIGAVVASTVIRLFGGYDTDYIFSRRLPVERTLTAWCVAFALLLVFAFALKITSFYSRVWTVSWFTGSAVLLAGGRVVIGHWVAQLAREGRIADRTVILGAGDQGLRLAAHLRAQDDPRTRLIGFIDDRRTRRAPALNGYEILGDTQDLIKMIRAEAVDQVFVALPWSAVERIHDLIHELSVTPVRICLAPEPLCLNFPNNSVMRVANVPMLQIFDRPISGWSYVTKTIEDRLIAALLILFTGPLMLLIALAIKFDSKGPVFFRQVRYGFNDTLFPVWKFRTMYVDMADDHCERQTRKADPRVTRVGQFLRRSSLDELPQFFNVLFGSMSLVGPRPHALATKAEGALFADIVDRYAARHRVKPGITGWAQVNGLRGETDTADKIKKRVEYDLYYIDNWSIWLDAWILLKTLVIVFNDDAAY